MLTQDAAREMADALVVVDGPFGEHQGASGIVGAHAAGGDVGHHDAELRDLLGQSQGGAREGEFAGVIDACPAPGRHSAHRGDVQDPPAATRAHAGQRRLDHRKGAEHIHLELGADLFEADLLDGAHKAIAGVVDQDVDPAHPRFGRLDAPSDRDRVGQVHEYARRMRREGFEGGLVGFASDGPDDHSAVGEHGLRQGSAQAAAGAGDEPAARAGGRGHGCVIGQG